MPRAHFISIHAAEHQTLEYVTRHDNVYCPIIFPHPQRRQVCSLFHIYLPHKNVCVGASSGNPLGLMCVWTNHMQPFLGFHAFRTSLFIASLKSGVRSTLFVRFLPEQRTTTPYVPFPDDRHNCFTLPLPARLYLMCFPSCPDTLSLLGVLLLVFPHVVRHLSILAPEGRFSGGSIFVVTLDLKFVFDINTYYGSLYVFPDSLLATRKAQPHRLQVGH